MLVCILWFLLPLYYRGSCVTFTCARLDVEEEGKGEGNGGEGWEEGREVGAGANTTLLDD